MTQVYVGIDVHRMSHWVTIIPLEIMRKPGNVWKKREPLIIRNRAEDFSRLIECIESYTPDAGEVKVAVDHTGGHYSEPIVRFLLQKGYDVCYLEAKAVKAARERLFDQENKSDVIDSAGAAFLLYLRDVHGMSFRISAATPDFDSIAWTLNNLILQRDQFTKYVSQVTNRLHQFMIAVFPEGEAEYFAQLLKVMGRYPTPHHILESNGLQGVSGLRKEDRKAIIQLAATTVGVPGDTYGWLIRQLIRQRKVALLQSERLSREIEEHLAAHPYGKVLLSFPRLGEIAAATIIGIIKDIDRWPDKKKFKKALGLYNSHTQSGGGQARSRRGKEGSHHSRRVLFLAGLRCITKQAPENDFRDYYQRLVGRGMPKKKAVMASIGKMAEIMYHCLKHSETYEYQGRCK